MDLRFVTAAARSAASIIGLLIFSALILATRCANYRDVFVGGDVYFTDADCYSRMTRARLCLEHPGLIIRHHSFENFPAGTTPHTTAPFDYFIVALAESLRPFTGNAIDLAGAWISPLLGLAGGWFLWWWARRNRLRYRAALLLLYGLSPILVHGTELGRPDHQALIILLSILAICSEWTLQTETSRGWSIANGIAWGLALWVSLYEPLILFAIVFLSQIIFARKNFIARHRRLGWVWLGAIVALGFALEQRLPVSTLFGADSILLNWMRTIGELRPVPITDQIWLRWCGLLLIPAPALLWIALRKNFAVPIFLGALLAATFLLTLWQARWAYFFVLIFALTLPGLLALIENQLVAFVAIGVSLLPILTDWDTQLWPNESQSTLRFEHRLEAVQWRSGARILASQKSAPFLAPWWWSPSIAYWSGQPGVAGSSHEALDGIARSAEFFLASEEKTARQILAQSEVAWVLVYDGDRVSLNSAALLGRPLPPHSLGYVLDRAPSQAPSFLRLIYQNGACKVFRVQLPSEKVDFPSVSH